jgi:hypothetical protein
VRHCVCTCCVSVTVRAIEVDIMDSLRGVRSRFGIIRNTRKYAHVAVDKRCFHPVQM